MLDTYIISISGSLFKRNWTMEALYSSTEWEHIRFLAKNIIKAMHWETVNPGKRDMVIA